MSVDLNADVGEGAGSDADLIPLVTSVNVACGAHAGTEADRRVALRTAATSGAVVGAHPSYPDRANFGRAVVAMSEADLEASLLEQFGHLRALCDELGCPPPRYVKPHGALYHRAWAHVATAEVLVRAIASVGITCLLHAPEAATHRCAARYGIRVVAEGFADRRYAASGRLAPRDEPGAVLTAPSEVAAQALALATGGPLPGGSAPEPRRVESICVHGDSPGALALARAVRGGLSAVGVAIQPFIR